jgi:hypothetical protein
VHWHAVSISSKRMLYIVADQNSYSLAMAEMTTLVTAIYQRYSTSIKPGYEDVAPGITSRFEVFYDDNFEKVAEHESWIDFHEG